MNEFKLVDTARSKSKLVARLVSTFSKNNYIVLHKGSEGRMTDSDIVDLILSKSSDPEKFKKYVKSRVKLLFSKISEFDTGYLVIDLDEVTCLKRLVFIITYKLSNGAEIPVSLPKVNERGYAVDALFTATTDQVYSDKIILKGSESISSSGDKHFFSRTEDYFDDLTTIKSELFSAPDEVKKSFNNLVKFFTGIPSTLGIARNLDRILGKKFKIDTVESRFVYLKRDKNLTDEEIASIERELSRYNGVKSRIDGRGFHRISLNDQEFLALSPKSMKVTLLGEIARIYKKLDSTKLRNSSIK